MVASMRRPVNETARGWIFRSFPPVENKKSVFGGQETALLKYVTFCSTIRATNVTWMNQANLLPPHSLHMGAVYKLAHGLRGWPAAPIILFVAARNLLFYSGGRAWAPANSLLRNARASHLFRRICRWIKWPPPKKGGNLRQKKRKRKWRPSQVDRMRPITKQPPKSLVSLVAPPKTIDLVTFFSIGQNTTTK